MNRTPHRLNRRKWNNHGVRGLANGITTYVDHVVEVQVGREVPKHIVHFSLAVDLPVGRSSGQAAVPGSAVVAARIGTGTLADISSY